MGQRAGMSPEVAAFADAPSLGGDRRSARNWMRDPRFDFPVLSVGCLVTAGLSVGLATALLEVSRTTTGPNVGPTAATLNDAFNALAGAALGLAAASGVVGSSVRRGPRVSSGLLMAF